MNFHQGVLYRSNVHRLVGCENAGANMAQGTISFLGIRGIQAGIEYYVCMIPLGLLPSMFVFSNEELPPEMRVQRVLNKARIPEMRDYILNNPSSYVFSALTASVDGEIVFNPVESAGELSSLGKIEVPIGARFLINDGQHRKAAIEAALKKNPRLRHEDISVVLYADSGLRRSQQIFSDLNRYAIRPTKSLNILFDNRDPFSNALCRMVDTLPFFCGWVEKEKGTMSNRAKALYTLSGIYHGSEALMEGLPEMDVEKMETLLMAFWTKLYHNIPEWQDVVEHGYKSSILRQESVCAHSLALIALGRAGNYLMKEYGDFDRMERLCNVDWSKENGLWIGHVVIQERISGSRSSTQYLTNELIKVLRGA